MTVLLVIHTIVVVFLIGIILIQRSSSDGMLGAGSNPFMSGKSSANFLTRTTAILATAFLVLSLMLAILASRSAKESSIIDQIGDAAPISAPVEKQGEAPTPADAGKAVGQEPVVPVR